MNLDNINLANIEKSTIIVSYPFEYDKDKVLRLNPKNMVQLNKDYLTDFLPYTKNNFFGEYQLSDESPKKITLPCIINHDSASTIEFYKDKKIKNPSIKVEKIEIYFFEKDIAILTIDYRIPDALSDLEYLYYHTKLSTLAKRSNQNLKTSNGQEFKYYYKFIDDLISIYTNKLTNIFTRSNMYTYNLLVADYCIEPTTAKKFLEPLTQYRDKLDLFNIDKISANHIQQTTNINTIANENVVVHIGIKRESDSNNFINNEFFKKYTNNHLLTYIITIYQVSKLEQLINKALIEEKDSKDLKNMRQIKSEMLYFISNVNFTKISNNSIRNNLYKFYRKSIDIKDMTEEVDTISEKITNELGVILETKSQARYTILNYLIAFFGFLISSTIAIIFS